jgi:phospholipid/cholesterol/gamma-HCH transport system substrate-binding protein
VGNSSAIGRTAALLALGLAIVVVLVIVLSSGSTYQIKAIFQNAAQVVTGDEVQTAGNPIGTISNISLTPDGNAQLTLTINNSHFTPLRVGTTAVIRQASLSGVANRYVDLNLGPGTNPTIPSGSTLGLQQTTTTVDLDELFNTLDAPTRKGLQDVIQGSASQYTGRGSQAQLAWQFLNPSIATSSLLFHELNRDTSKFTRFVTTSSNLVTDLAQRQSDLSGLIGHLSTTFGALAAQHVALGQAIDRLPPFMRLANTTFVNLRSALVDLTSLINASRPVAPKLQKLLAQLRPLAVDAVPTIRDLSNIISRPGPNNDLIELTKLAVPLAQVTVGTVRANGALRPGAFTVSTQALHQSVPELAIGRRYAPDLTGWFEGYSHPGQADANGGAGRVAPVAGVASIESGVLNLCSSAITAIVPGCSALQNLLTNPTGRAAFAQGILTTGQGDRCPGSMERGAPGSTTQPPAAAGFYESGYPCDPTMVPTGP